MDKVKNMLLNIIITFISIPISFLLAISVMVALWTSGSSSSSSSGDGSNSDDMESVSSTGMPIYLDFIAGWEDSTVWRYMNGKAEYSSYLGKVITEDKKYFICYTDGYGDRNYGYGVCHYTGSGWNNVDAYKKEGINIKENKYNNIGSSKLEKEIVMNVYKIEANSKRDAIKKQLKKANITLTSNQLDALTSVYYQYGNIGNFCEAYKKYGDTDALKDNAYAYGATYKYYFKEVKPGGDNARKRGEANWKLFHNGKYIVQGGEELDVSSYNESGSSSSNNTKTDDATRNKILKIANSKKGHAYKWGTTGPNTFDCSGFAYWVYKQVGINVPRGSDGYKSYIGTKKEKKISEAKPGDILHILGSERSQSAGHVAIYIDENTTIEAMGKKWGVCNGKVKGRFKRVFDFVD